MNSERLRVSAYFFYLFFRCMRRVFALSLFFLCISASATDLLETYRTAKNNDPVINAARYALEGLRQRIPQARAALLPSMNVVGSNGTTKAETSFTNVPTVERRMNSWAWTLQLTQPLIRANAIYAYQQSQHIVEQAEAQYEQAEQDFLLRVVQTYFGVSVAQEVIEASAVEVRALEEQLGQVTRGFKSGTHSLIDVDDTKARLGLARSRQVAAQNDLESKRAELERVTGRTFVQLAVLRPSVHLPGPQPKDNRAWMDQARVNHPLVRAQRAALAASQSEIKKNRAEHAPTLNLVASKGNNYSSSSLVTPNEFGTRASSAQIGLQLNIPIYSGGATNARVSEAIANKNKAEADLEAASRQAATDAQQAFAGVINGLAQIEALNFAKESGQSAVKGNRLGYGLGLRINLDVLNAEQQLYAAKRDLAVARYDTLLQGLRLKAATGVLNASDLLAINDMLWDDAASK